MTIEEYSTLMGYEKTCPMAEYETADFIYMMAGDMDKQTFCKEYKKIGSSPLVLALAEAANESQKAFRDKQKKEQNAAQGLLRKADAVRAAGLDDEAGQIDKIAASLIGRKDCIKWKLAHGFSLNYADKDYIIDNLL